MTFSWNPIQLPDIPAAPQSNPLKAGQYFEEWKKTSQGRSVIKREAETWRRQQRLNQKDSVRYAESEIKKNFRETDFYKDYLKGYSATFNKDYSAWEAETKTGRELSSDISSINTEGQALAESIRQEQAAQPGIVAESSRLINELTAAAALQKKKDTAQLQRAKAQASQLSIQQQQKAAVNAPIAQQPKQRQKTSTVGAPKAAFTRISRLNMGGYSGTAPGRVNPTGLNI